MRVHACAASRQRRMSDNAMLGKGRAVRCRAVKTGGQSSEGEYHKWTVWGLSRIFGPAYIPKDLRTDHGLRAVHD